jgi:hypothetical protein
MSAMGPTLVTRTARDQILALDEDGREAVDAAIEDLRVELGEPIDLPAAPEGTTYRAMKARGEDAPVVIYRAIRKGESGGCLILALMTPDEYKDVLELQKFLAEAPAVHELAGGVPAGVSRESSGRGKRRVRVWGLDEVPGPASDVDIPLGETLKAEDEAHRRK